ncbi:uncharacterized protein LOC143039913 isoform X1 [Oratosquilla oratoria]|uniref:uncharacterized protein LOC143039913 isoform X1 n=1 Tax=Oratosquilla oratoria TaxID=337810 RepID=UPI003F7739C3
MPIQDDPDSTTAVSHNKEKELCRLELLHETEARQSLQAVPIQGNPNNAAAAWPVSSQGKDFLGKLCDVTAVQQELEAVKKQRDALIKEKEEWSKERIVLRSEVTNVYTKVKYNLHKFFSPSQVEHMLNRTCIRCWSDDDISKCIALRNLSPKAYRYLKEVWQLPLPSVTTLNRWASKFNTEPGILKAVFHLLEHEAKDMREEDRLQYVVCPLMSVVLHMNGYLTRKQIH